MTSGRSRRCAELAVVLAASTALGCGDPSTGVNGARVAPLVLSETDAGAFQVAFEDARVRVLPGMATASSRALAPVLDSLASAIRTRDRQALQVAVARAEATMD